MTPQGIIRQVQKLPPSQQREVLQTLSQTINGNEQSELTEAEIAERLLAKGVISEVPAGWNEPEDSEFEPIIIRRSAAFRNNS